MAVAAVQHVRRMRGGAQSHLMRCSDGYFYVVKFQDNPQHTRVLANEMLATRLAQTAGLPVPVTEVVEVNSWLIEHTPELRFELLHGSKACTPGLQFGSRFVVPPMQGLIYDYLPEHLLDRVRNLGAFAGILALDKWTCNANGRQAAFWKKSRERKFTVSFIDQGYCFNAGEWSFPDSPLRGVYARNDVYREVTGLGELPALAGQYREHGRAGDVALRRGDSDGMVRRELRHGAVGGELVAAAPAGGRADPGVQALEPDAIPKVEGCGELREERSEMWEGSWKKDGKRL